MHGAILHQVNLRPVQTKRWNKSSTDGWAELCEAISSRRQLKSVLTRRAGTNVTWSCLNRVRFGMCRSADRTPSATMKPKLVDLLWLNWTCWSDSNVNPEPNGNAMQHGGSTTQRRIYFKFATKIRYRRTRMQVSETAYHLCFLESYDAHAKCDASTLFPDLYMGGRIQTVQISQLTGEIVFLRAGMKVALLSCTLIWSTHPRWMPSSWLMRCDGGHTTCHPDWIGFEIKTICHWVGFSADEIYTCHCVKPSRAG